MAGIVPDEGDRADLTALLGATGGLATIRLYRAALLPAPGTVAADFVEANFAGYSPITSSGWTAAATDPSGVSYMVSPPLTWTKSAGGTANDIYGIYITVNQGGIDRVIYAEEFPLSIPMTATGAQVNRQVTYTSRRAA